MLNNKGFSLVELIVVMGIFMTIMLITSYTFDNILSKGGQQLKSAETNTEGIVGLEMLRSDLEHIGYGLPWSFSATPTAITEAADAANTPVTGINASAYNDAPPSAVRLDFTPTDKKIIDNSGTSNPGAAYLVIKSTNVALNGAARKWAYVNYSTNPGTGDNESYVKKWDAAADDFSGGERVVTIASSFSAAGVPNKQLMVTSGGSYFYTMPDPVPAVMNPTNDSYKPGDGSQLYVVYGVDPDTNLTMPYNRADYYVKNDGNRPASCNLGTGILYKGVVRQGAGTFVEYPLLNCVGDLQVEFELDRDSDGNITYSPTLTDTGGTTLTPTQIRSQLKNVRVYILAHEGSKDRNFTYNKNTIQVGDPARGSSGRTLNATALQTVFGSDWRNYRWKVYTIVVQPKNLN